MKVLLQYPESGGSISGVNVYVSLTAARLSASRDFDVRLHASRGLSALRAFRDVRWADVVHMNSNDLTMVLLCKALRRPTLVKVHYSLYQSTHSEYVPMSPRRRVQTEVRLLIRKYGSQRQVKELGRALTRLFFRLLTLRLVDAVSACSDFMAKSCDLGRPVRALPNPVALPNEEASVSTAEDPPVFLFTGRLTADKGCDVLLRAARILSASTRDFRVHVVGDGDAASQLRSLASLEVESGIVTFLGKRSHEETLAEIGRAVALVTPARWLDPAPYPPLEAAIRGVPTIATRMGGLVETATPFAYFFETEDDEGLACHMQTILNDVVSARERGAKAKAWVMERHLVDVAVGDLVSVLSELRRGTASTGR